MAYRFIPPYGTYTVVLDKATGLTREQSYGITVLKESGAYRQVIQPSQYELEAASTYYLGNHVYMVDDTEGAALNSAGYGSYLTYVGPDASPGLYSDIYYDTYTGAY